jgi:RNA polymerase sigma factor (sigma-70 family)
VVDESLEKFVERVRSPLVGALSLYCGERGAAEDIAQEALARAWNQWSRIDSPQAWVFHVAFNLARTRARRARHERVALERSDAIRQGRETDPAEASSPDDVETVRRAVIALPLRQRQAIVLRHFLDLPTAEVAEIMGCAEGTVRSTLHQATESLRRSVPISLEVTDA